MSDALNSSYIKRKIIVLSGLSAMLLIGVVWIFMLQAKADDYKSEQMQDYDDFRVIVGTEISDGLITSIDAIFNSEEFNLASMKEPMINDFFKGAKSRIEDDGRVQTMTDIVMVVAMILVMIYSFIELFKELQRGDGGIDMWAKCFTVVTLSVVVVVNYQMIIDVMEGLGRYLLDEFIANASSSTSSLKDWIASEDPSVSPFKLIHDKPESIDFPYIPDALDSAGTAFTIALYQIILTLLLVVMEIPLMSARVVLLTMLIELVVRKVFFPMAMSAVCTGGMRSPGVAYMKKLLGLYVRLAMCVLISIIGDLLVTHLMAWTTTSMFYGVMRIVCVFIVYITCVKLFSNTTALSNSIVGTH